MKRYEQSMFQSHSLHVHTVPGQTQTQIRHLLAAVTLKGNYIVRDKSELKWLWWEACWAICHCLDWKDQRRRQRRETLMETVKDGYRQNGFIFFNQEMEWKDEGAEGQRESRARSKYRVNILRRPVLRIRYFLSFLCVFGLWLSTIKDLSRFDFIFSSIKPTVLCEFESILI